MGASSFLTRIYLEDLGVSIAVSRATGELMPLQRVFTEEDCRGHAFLSAAFADIVFPTFDPNDTTLYVASPEIVADSPLLRGADVSFGNFCASLGTPRSRPNQLPVVPFLEPLGLDFPLELPLVIRTLQDPQ